MTLGSRPTGFDDKSHKPTDEDLRAVLGKAHALWIRLIEAVGKQVEPITELWAYTSKSTGWGLRLRHKERVILYMSPRVGQFLVSFALGEKAVAAAHALKLPPDMHKIIDEAPRYAEGRGVRFVVSRSTQIRPLALLARVKHEN